MSRPLQEVAARGGKIIMVGDAHAIDAASVTLAGEIRMPDMAPDFAAIVYAAYARGPVRLPRFQRVERLRQVWRRAGWPEAGMTARRWRRLASLARSDRTTRAAVGAGVGRSTTTGSRRCGARSPRSRRC